MGKIAYVNKDDCTSCNQCADNLPKYFRMDENDTSETHINGENVNNAEIPEEDVARVQKEMDECPGECILWKK
ncbi:MAG: ferredoxin [Leptospiraceae bacterium]|nr:ferredoxin [Leptospiraceae bacterium]